MEYHTLHEKPPDISKNYDKQGFQKYNYAGWGYRPLGILYKDDKTKRWDFNEDKTDIIEGSVKLTTGKTEYRITENGKIEKLSL